jgi:bidirectional [NiFe] hydrogenase diaphorase subunit
MGTACYVKGADKILATLESQLGVRAGQTTPDGQVSVLVARCIGACGIAPAVVFDGQVAPRQTPESVLATLQPWLTHGSESTSGH